MDILQEMIVFLRSIFNEVQRCKTEKISRLFEEPEVKKENKQQPLKSGVKNVKY